MNFFPLCAYFWSFFKGNFLFLFNQDKTCNLSRKHSKSFPPANIVEF